MDTALLSALVLSTDCAHFFQFDIAVLRDSQRDNEICTGIDSYVGVVLDAM